MKGDKRYKTLRETVYPFSTRVEIYNPRGQSYKVRGGMLNGDVPGQFSFLFIHREWWGLGKHCQGVMVKTGTIVVFKRLLGRHMQMQGMQIMCTQIISARHHVWHKHCVL